MNGPLEPGDPIGLATETDLPGAYQNGQTGDLIIIAVPVGRGLALEQWLRRQFFDTPEIIRDRREQDTLARFGGDRA